MTGKSESEKAIADILIVDRLEDIRLLLSRKHSIILNLVTEKELSISDMARSLGMNPGSVHYYLKDLEKHGMVKLVRQEIKGGIVKKFYRSSARHIVIERPAFPLQADHTSFPAPCDIEDILKSIEYFGYHLPPDHKDDAIELLMKYDKRMKDLLIDLEKSGIEDFEVNGYVVDSVFHLILGIKAKHDPELDRLFSEFEKMFMRYE